MPILLIILTSIQVDSFLDKLNPSMLSDLRNCLDKRMQNSLIACDNSIYSFLSAATLSIEEIYNLYETEVKSKTSTSKILGVQSGLLQLISSSMKDTSNHPNRAMYGYTKREGKSCWCSYLANSNQYIQVGSMVPLMFYTVGTKGDPDDNNWITSYRILYSLEGFEWIYYNESVVFTGNSDRNTEVLYNFNPFIARSVKLVPVSWTGSICTRLEFTVSKAVFDPVTPRSSKEILVPGVLTGLNLVTYSMWDSYCDQSRAYIDFRSNLYCRGYIPGLFDTNQWVIIAAYDFVWWHRVSLQGRGDGPDDEFISSVSIAYTKDGNVWTPYKGGKDLRACFDRLSVVSIELEQFYAIAIKIFVKSFSKSPSGKFEAYYTRN